MLYGCRADEILLGPKSLDPGQAPSPRPGSPSVPRLSMLLNDSAWRRAPSSSNRGVCRHISPPAPLQPAPVFEGEAGAVGAHSVLPQELLEASLQLRFAGLPLIAPGVAPETVAVENAGVVEARHDCTWRGDEELEWTGGSARPPLRPDAWVFGSKREAGVSQLRLRGGGRQLSQDKPLPTLTTPPYADACRPPVVSAPGSRPPLPSLPGLTSPRTPMDQKRQEPPQSPSFAGKTRRRVRTQRPLHPHWFARAPRPAIGPFCALEPRLLDPQPKRIGCAAHNVKALDLFPGSILCAGKFGAKFLPGGGGIGAGRKDGRGPRAEGRRGLVEDSCALSSSLSKGRAGERPLSEPRG